LGRLAPVEHAVIANNPDAAEPLVRIYCGRFSNASAADRSRQVIVINDGSGGGLLGMRLVDWSRRRRWTPARRFEAARWCR
jgi:hypothetical protein